MNNETKLKIVIKQRNDGVYDLYVNNEHIRSRGHYKSILSEIENYIKEIDTNADDSSNV